MNEELETWEVAFLLSHIPLEKAEAFVEGALDLAHRLGVPGTDAAMNPVGSEETS